MALKPYNNVQELLDDLDHILDLAERIHPTPLTQPQTHVKEWLKYTFRKLVITQDATYTKSEEDSI